MSQEYMDPEIFADFIVEAKEHLETIEPNLLELEKAPDNLALLNEIFRPMHSLKGASGFLGLNRMNQLAHKAENILDELRKGDMVITSEIMDVILSATDALRQMIDNLESSGAEGDVFIESIISVIDTIMSGEVPGGSTPAPVQASSPQASDASSSVEPSVADWQHAADEAFAALSTGLEHSSADGNDADAQPAFAAPSPVSSTSGAGGEAAGDALSAGDSVTQGNAGNAAWVASLEETEPYVLTAFGEGHLRDFIDEAREMTEQLGDGLLELERHPDGKTERVNDLFRFFHNLKGNSGIIGFRDLNSLTHEAETLLNNVRKGEMQTSPELVDLLLLVVDVIDALVSHINVTSGTVTGLQIDELLDCLRQVVGGGEVRLPQGITGGITEDTTENTTGEQQFATERCAAEQVTLAADDVAHAHVEVPAVASAEASSVQQESAASGISCGNGFDDEDVEVFTGTVGQQMDNIKVALQALSKDSEQREFVDALYRCLVTVQNSCAYMGIEDVRVYAERTAGLVDQARSTGLDFGLMVDLLEQETFILGEMISKAIAGMTPAGCDAATVTPASSVQGEGGAVTAAGGAAVAGASGVTVASVALVSDASAPTPSVDSGASATATRASGAEVGEAKVASEASAPASVRPSSAAKAEATSAGSPAATAAPEAKRPAPSKGAAKPAPNQPAAAQPALKQPASGASRPAAVQAGATASAGAQTAAKTSSTIRVDHEKLDHLMNLIGELIINRNRYSMIARRLEEGGNKVNIPEIAQNLSETTYAMARLSDDLQDTIMKVRMVPVSSVFSRFPRLVRDLSRKSGKEVELILEGEETELDKSVVEVIGDPLVHLIRNAVDHGVESEEERIAKGKKPKGTVVLRAFHRGNSVAIEIEDDGKGIDPEKMREVAIRKGVITADEARALDDREAMELIFAPGFSSAEAITDISGRGVGMDVVRTNIKNLKGSVSIYSEVGKGTRFTLLLPLTLAIIDALMVNVAGQMYAIPLDAVSETTKIEARRLTDIKGRKAVTLRGEVLGIMDLSELLILPRSEAQEVLSVVVIHDNDRRLGLVVDSLLERQEIVIKPLGTYLGDLRGISGATIMGDGSVILILDPHEIYLMATSKAL